MSHCTWLVFHALLPESRARRPANEPQVLEYFKLLGRTLARALQDSRLLDLPLSHVFYRAALGRPLDLADVHSFDPALHASLAKLAAAAAEWRAAGCKGEPTVDGAALPDLCLTFQLPGEPLSWLQQCFTLLVSSL